MGQHKKYTPAFTSHIIINFYLSSKPNQIFTAIYAKQRSKSVNLGKALCTAYHTHKRVRQYSSKSTCLYRKIIRCRPIRYWRVKQKPEWQKDHTLEFDIIQTFVLCQQNMTIQYIFFLFF